MIKEESTLIQDLLTNVFDISIAALSRISGIIAFLVLGLVD